MLTFSESHGNVYVCYGYVVFIMFMFSMLCFNMFMCYDPYVCYVYALIFLCSVTLMFVMFMFCHVSVF